MNKRELILKAHADWNKAEANRKKAGADMEKAWAAQGKADADLKKAMALPDDYVEGQGQ